MSFDPHAYGPLVAGLLTNPPGGDLGPGRPNEKVRPTLAGLTAGQLFTSRQPVDDRMARACLSALWLRHGFLHESHTLSQGIDTPTGSYWHGIMHRREPDYGNAKYWFRRVGRHPVFSHLAAAARKLAAGSAWQDTLCSPTGEWDPFVFVDLCQQAAAASGELAALCCALQQREWELLFDYCYARALAPEGRG
jgi:hypothetical protein